MEVIGRPASGQQQNVFLARDSADVLPESFRISDEVGTIFGAEDAMYKVAGVGVRHKPEIIACN